MNHPLSSSLHIPYALPQPSPVPRVRTFRTLQEDLPAGPDFCGLQGKPQLPASISWVPRLLFCGVFEIAIMC